LIYCGKSGLSDFFGLIGAAAHFFNFPAFLGEFFSHGCVVGAEGGFCHFEFAEFFEDFIQFDGFSGDELVLDPVADDLRAWSGFFVCCEFWFDDFIFGCVLVVGVAEGGG